MSPGSNKVRASFVFTPWEGRRLIGKAVAAMPVVRNAYANGEMIIAHGSTNVFVAEEVMGEVPHKPFYLSGQVINNVLCQTQPEEKPPIIHLVKGKLTPPAPRMDEMLRNFDSTSVFIKGGNAVDPEFNAGVFCAHPGAGTIGFAMGIVSARGSQLIIPIGLEKLVPSVTVAARHMGQDTFYYHSGQRTGMMPVTNGTIVTEVQALKILFDIDDVTHVGGGGAMGSEGSVVLVAEAEKDKIDAAVALYESIKGEPPLRTLKAYCAGCIPTTPSLDASPDEQKQAHLKKHCLYEGIEEADLPAFFTPRTEPITRNR
jgi:hypothetical protein